MTRVIDGYFWLLKALIALFLAIMVVLVFGNVVLRYAFNSGITVSEEVSRAEQLAADLCSRFGEGRAAAAADVSTAVSAAEGIVNTTPVGMDKYPGLPLDPGLLRREHWVADIIYFPLETALLRQARALGCRTMGGGGMAVFQAVGAFRLFAGIDPDAERMARHFASL